jgi:hypothetical protein
MPWPCCSESNFSRPRHCAAWAWHMWISVGCPESACGRPAHVWFLSASTWELHKVCYEKHANPLNCRTSSSDISGYHVDFQERHSIVGEWDMLYMRVIQKISSDGLLKKIYTTNHVYCHLMYTLYTTFQQFPPLLRHLS